MSDYELALKIAEKVSELGGKVYFVGGYVRDELLHLINKDIDIEIYGISEIQLKTVLSKFGSVNRMGNSFGIYAVAHSILDISLPRDEQNEINPYISERDAASRRDFTINALMKNVLTGEILDFFGGLNDLNNKIIKVVNDECFSSDPLRVLRACQFSARFDFNIEAETLSLAKKINLSNLPKERIFEELKKVLLKAERPSIFFEDLREINQLDYWFPELKALIGVEQNPKFHPEGDVWNHTMMAIDTAAAFRNKAENPLGFMLTVVCHDFGKPITTKVINGKITSYAHETLGLPLVKNFIERLTTDKTLKKYILNIVSLHMKPNQLAAQNSGIKASNKMFDAAISQNDLLLMAKSDKTGRVIDYSTTEEFLLERLKIYNEYMSRPFVSGDDLINCGLTPDEFFSDALNHAHQLRLSGIKKEQALRETLAYINKKKRD